MLGGRAVRTGVRLRAVDRVRANGDVLEIDCT
jgi:hypothetical protein